MSKDGTYRGGRRVRAGDKPNSLVDKIASGRSARIFETLDLKDEPSFELDSSDFLDPEDLEGEKMEDHWEQIRTSTHHENQRFSMGTQETLLLRNKIFEETWLWLKKRKCNQFINPRLVESYFQAFARYVQCEEAISKFGFLGKHPTTGAAIANPFVQMSALFQKQANIIWYEIFDIVKQNCTTSFTDTPQQNNAMELLLTARRKR